MDYSPPLSRDAIITALFDLLVQGCNANFTADFSAGDPVLRNVSAFQNLRLGIPVFGPGIAASSEIRSLDPDNEQLTLDTPPLLDGPGAALFSGFQTTGRRLKPWAQVTALPAMFLRHIGDEYLTAQSLTQQRPTGIPAKIYIDCQIWVYSVAGTDGIPEDAVNTLIDLVEAVLQPRPAGAAQTLGGLVRHCWIDGKITIDPGDLDGQAKAVIPVRLLVPGTSPPGVARLL